MAEKPGGILNYFRPSGSGVGSNSKRQHEPEPTTNDESDVQPQKKQKSSGSGVKIATVLSWRASTKHDLSWIEYEASQGKVTKVWCRFCSSEPKLVRNIIQQQGKVADIEAFIKGTTNLRKTNMDRHASSRPHLSAKGEFFIFLKHQFSKAMPDIAK